MRKENYTVSRWGKSGISDLFRIKTIFYFLVLFGLASALPAQVHDHDDTIRILDKNDFTFSIADHSNNNLELEVKYNRADSITPVFIEFAVRGFQFTDDCIQQQTVNNIEIDKNIEKIWGPQFVSLGLNQLPPNGTFKLKLATLNDLAAGNLIRIRVFGSLQGEDFLWSTTFKN